MSPVSRDKKYYELLKQLIGTLHKSTAVVQPLNGVDLLIHIYTVCPHSKGLLYQNSFLRFSLSCRRILNITTKVWRNDIMFKFKNRYRPKLKKIHFINASLNLSPHRLHEHLLYIGISMSHTWIRNKLSHSLRSTNDVFIALQVLWSLIKFFCPVKISRH